MGHTTELGVMFPHYNEYGHCSLFIIIFNTKWFKYSQNP